VAAFCYDKTMTRKVKGLKLSPGQYIGLLAIISSIPVLIIALINKETSLIFIAFILAFFGFIFRANGYYDRMTYRGVELSPWNNDPSLFAKIGRVCTYVFAGLCLAWIVFSLYAQYIAK